MWPASVQIYENKRNCYIRKEFNSHRICLETNMAAVSLFWNTNMAAVKYVKTFYNFID